MAAGDISKSLASKLAIALEDPHGTSDNPNLTEDEKIDIISDAQIELANLINNEYLTEFETASGSQSAPNGAYSLSSLDSGNGVFKGAGGVIKVNAGVGGSTWLWSHLIDYKDIEEVDNPNFDYSDTFPIHYIFAGVIQVLIDTYTSFAINVSYLKHPPVCTTSVDPIINKALHPLLLRMAEARGWNQMEKPERAAKAMELAVAQIKVLNQEE